MPVKGKTTARRGRGNSPHRAERGGKTYDEKGTGRRRGGEAEHFPEERGERGNDDPGRHWLGAEQGRQRGHPQIWHVQREGTGRA